MLLQRRVLVLPKHYYASVFAASSSSLSSSFLTTSRHPPHNLIRSVVFSSGTHPLNSQRTILSSLAPSSPTKSTSQEMSTMLQPPQTLQDALSKGQLYTDNMVYRFLQLPVSHIHIALKVVAQATTTGVSTSNTASTTTPFVALLIDKDEVTVMVPSNIYDQCTTSTTTDSPLLTSDNHQVGAFSYRLITFDIVLEPTLVGFMAYITKALAEAQISVLPLAAYSRDHIFVQEADLDKALRVLQGLILQCQPSSVE